MTNLGTFVVGLVVLALVAIAIVEILSYVAGRRQSKQEVKFLEIVSEYVKNMNRLQDQLAEMKKMYDNLYFAYDKLTKEHLETLKLLETYTEAKAKEEQPKKSSPKKPAEKKSENKA